MVFSKDSHDALAAPIFFDLKVGHVSKIFLIPSYKIWVRTALIDIIAL